MTHNIQRNEIRNRSRATWVLLLLTAGFIAGAFFRYLLGGEDIMAKPARQCTREELKQRLDMRNRRLEKLSKKYFKLDSQAPAEERKQQIDELIQELKQETEPLLYDLYLLENPDKSFEEWKKDQLLWDGWWEKPPHSPPLRPEEW